MRALTGAGAEVVTSSHGFAVTVTVIAGAAILVATAAVLALQVETHVTTILV